MSFEEQWAQHQAVAAEKQSMSMQLNRLPDEDRVPTPPANGDLKVSQKDLAAVGDVAYTMYTRLNKEGDLAKDETLAAARSLMDDNFSLGSSLQSFAFDWDYQVSSICGAFAHISNHLDYTKNAHAGDEVAIATSFSAAELSAGFDEGTQQS